MIFKHDHPPAHVHVLGGSGRAKVRLNCTASMIHLEWHEGIQRGDLRHILEAIEIEIQRLCREWKVIHG